MADDLEPLALALGRLADGLTPEGMRSVLDQIGVAAKADAASAARVDLGSDGAFSRWRKKDGGVMPLLAKYQHHTQGVGLTLHREPRSAGPWRVAEDGRKARAAGDVTVYPGRRKKDGTLGKPRRYVHKGGGATKGKGTWSDVEAEVLAKTPQRAQEAIQSELLKLWG